MPAMLLRPWIERLFVAGSLTVLVPMSAIAGWPWKTPAPAVATPVGPPIYTPSAPATVTNYQPAYPVPSNTVPTASPPTLLGAPTTYTPAPVTGVVPAPAVVGAPVVSAPVVAAPACGTCQPVGMAPRVTGYVPPNYSSHWVQVPTTTYRPVVSTDPATGLPINAVQPCTTAIWQARRVPNSWWGGLWPATSAPPSVVAYTPATIAAYPQARVTNYAPPVTTVIAPRPVVTQYAPAPVVTQYAPAPVVTQYAPAPVVTQYAPAPVVTQYAPAPAPVVTQYAPATTTVAPQYAPAPAPTTTVIPTTPAPQACPHGCPNGQCQQAPASVPAGTYPLGTDPANVAPSLSAPRTISPGTTIVPNTGTGREPASIAPRLDSGSTTRSYPPTEYDNQPLVPVNPPVERRVIETPRIEAPQLQSPGVNSSSQRMPQSSPFIPFARPTEKPASTVVPERNLRLVPDPDADKLELRRDEIPNLIKPGDRTTQAMPGRGVSVPIAWPTKPTTVMKPSQELKQPVLMPASISTPKLDESGWRSVAQ